MSSASPSDRAPSELVGRAVGPAASSSLWTPAILQVFFDQAPFQTGILSPDGIVLEVARSALEACGYTFEDVLNKTFWETAWWRGFTETQDRIKAAFIAVKKGEHFQAVLPYRIADGSDHWVEFGMSPVFGPGGALAFVLAVGIDITTRVAAESELAVVRNRVDSALLAGDIGTFEWDVDSERVRGDQNFTELFGFALGANESAPLAYFLERIHPEDRGPLEESIRRCLATGENYEGDYRIELPSGERWVNSRGRVTQDKNGRAVNFFGLVTDITSRKRAEAERVTIADRLRQLTAVHETVLTGIKDFAYVFDLDGRFRYANRPLLLFYGRTLDEVVGKTFSELGYPAWHAEMHLREIAQVVATKRPFQGEIPFIGESGVTGVYDYIFSPIFNSDGNVEAVTGITRDVTERKRVEVRDRLLVDLDDATRLLSDPASIAEASASVLAAYLGVKHSAYAEVGDDYNTLKFIGGVKLEAPGGEKFHQLDHFGNECMRLLRKGENYIVHDSVADLRTAEVQDSYQTHHIRSIIWVPLLKSGNLVAAMVVYHDSPRAWLQSDIEGVQLVVGRCWEWLERTRIVRELSQSEQRLRLAVSTGRLGVWEIDLVTQVLTCSDQCKANYGRAQNTFFSSADMLAAVHPEDRGQMEAVLNRSVAVGGEFEVEYRTVWPGGGTHWILVRGQVDHGIDGKTQRLIGVSLDITARKRAESEQVKLREEAVRASRAKDDFLAMLSHELRTPLNPILLLASDAALDTGLSPGARAAFNTIRKNVELEARLIDDLLDLTSIVRGKLTIKKEFKGLRAILADAIAAVEPELTDKAISFELSFDDNTPDVHVDEVRIIQVFINLLKNAAKFTPQNGKISLRTAVEGEWVTARITDNGIGLTADEITRVFTAFEQGEHADEQGSSHRFGGLGLGLAISQRLVALHGGSIEAASAGRGRGAAFTVKIPLPAPRRQPPILKHASASHSGDEDKNIGTRILLIEDHDGTRRALEQLLRKRKYEVISAASLSQARACVEKGTFDLVVSDLGLPDGDGTTLMAELRDRHGLKGIALTGYGMEEDIARCKAAGFVAHLTKPIHVEALEEVLRVACGV